MQDKNAIDQVFVFAARQCLAEGMVKIEHCVGQLDEASVWWRPAEGMNSVANLMLHLASRRRGGPGSGRHAGSSAAPRADAHAVRAEGTETRAESGPARTR